MISARLLTRPSLAPNTAARERAATGRHDGAPPRTSRGVRRCSRRRRPRRPVISSHNAACWRSSAAMDSRLWGLLADVGLLLVALEGAHEIGYAVRSEDARQEDDRAHARAGRARTGGTVAPSWVSRVAQMSAWRRSFDAMRLKTAAARCPSRSRRAGRTARSRHARA